MWVYSSDSIHAFYFHCCDLTPLWCGGAAGFMGVGFKAVYKRFARVCVYDSVWRFRFEEPAVTPPMEPTHSW